jgi:hypothetical protein
VDLSEVIADGTDGLGHDTLARYYRGLFGRYLPDSGYAGCFRVRAALNFGVQQLATRSRVSPGSERYLQVGGYAAHDLAAALIEAMPHTRVVFVMPAPGTQIALIGLREVLGADAMPDVIDVATSCMLEGVFGLIAIFAEGAMPTLEPWRRWLNPGGKILLVHRVHEWSEPRLSLHA